MYSATHDQSSLEAVRKTAPEALKKALQRVNRQWNALHEPQIAVYQAYEKPPDKLLQALSLCTTAISDYLNDHPQGLDSGLKAFYFDALQFSRVAESFDEHFLFDVHKREYGRQRNASTLCLRNVVPAGLDRKSTRLNSSH